MSNNYALVSIESMLLFLLILVGEIEGQKLLNPKLICIKLEFGLKCSYMSIFYSYKNPLPKPLRDFCNFKSKRGTKRSKLRNAYFSFELIRYY